MWKIKCNTCYKGFRTSNSLKVHELTHTNVKPFNVKHVTYNSTGLIL